MKGEVPFHRTSETRDPATTHRSENVQDWELGERSMRHLSSTSWLMIWGLVLLCGCGGGARSSGPTSAPTSGPPQQGLNIVSNWQFSTTSTLTGTPPLTIAGSITESGSSVS